MASSSCSKIMEIPKLFLFTEGGIYSGGKYDKSFNYKVIPSKEEMTCYIWYGKLCLDKTEEKESRSFPITEEGHRDMVKWIEDTYLAAPRSDDYPESFFMEGTSVIP